MRVNQTEGSVGSVAPTAQSGWVVAVVGIAAVLPCRVTNVVLLILSCYSVAEALKL